MGGLGTYDLTNHTCFSLIVVGVGDLAIALLVICQAGKG